MASDKAVIDERPDGIFEPAAGRSDTVQALLEVLDVLASLKITVVLFAMAIFIIFAGTMAQTQKDIWVVVHEYFRTAFAWIDFQVFFPKSFFPPKVFPALQRVPGGFYFPGGWLIGAAMAVNLLAAHTRRFHIQASGPRLHVGLGVIGLGCVVTWLVIAGGSSDGLQGQPFFEWSTLWGMVKVAEAALAALVAYLISRLPPERRTERRLLGTFSALLGLLALWLFYEGDKISLGDSSMRILWQLLQGTFAGLVLLAGCWLVFAKRAGIVLLHSGVGLLMFSELLVGTLAVEAQMSITEGETVNFVQDNRTTELAVIDSSDPNEDYVVVIPESFLMRGTGRIRHEYLPFDVEVVRFLKNASRPRRVRPDDQNPATDGIGKDFIVDERPPGTGTDTESKVDMSAAYVRFFKKGTDESLGTFLVGLFLSLSDISEKVTVEGKTYDVALRHKRTYKPYSLRLDDVRADSYLGTDMTRNYSSDVRLVDPTRKVDREVHIWMNNPLRFAGETFYQSNFYKDKETGVETTGLQVVSNTGWMIPYVSCMIVGVGLLFQFSVTLLRFLKRQEAEVSAPVSAPAAASGRGTGVVLGRLFPWLVVAMFGAYVANQARPPHVPDDAFDFYAAGQLPIVYQGRVKPLDTLARNSLNVVSWKETITDENGKKQPAVRWLFDLATGSEQAEKYNVFWIDDPTVLDVFQLPRRKTHLYSGEELRPHFAEIRKQAAEAHELKPDQLSTFQRRLVELERMLREVQLLQGTFQPPPIGDLPNADDLRSDDPAAKQRLAQLREALVDLPRRLAAVHPPLVVPTKGNALDPQQEKSDRDKFEWQPFSTAWTRSLVKSRMLGQDPDAATAAWSEIMTAYMKNDPATFNRAVRDYQALLVKDPPPELKTSHAGFEAYFNHFAPFYRAAAMYLCAFVLAVLSWLVWTGPLNRAAFGLTLLALAVHSFAIEARMYISGRPPVTNLYTTAVFIGWGCVVLCLVFERFYRVGVGNVIAGLTGFATLLIAHFLSADGDTFTVLQAVLDTQFWLATHVVIINMGYAATLLAGVLGGLYILRGMATPSLNTAVEKDLTRMIYGTLCFAIFFSFVGTVLGGLWADDSWGRFWGWDPKENGALMIVLWNALVLHARWGGMVKSRGLALLAVAGGIFTAWSWFGVNELGIGLHSYGFTEGRLKYLGLFVASQLALIAAGSLPKDFWWSFRARERTA